jgi:hypothetical protein
MHMKEEMTMERLLNADYIDCVIRIGLFSTFTRDLGDD